MEIGSSAGMKGNRREGACGLLQVLLGMSQKYEMNELKKIMMCDREEHNPNADPSADLCLDFLNTGKCNRPAGSCRYRHVLSNHIEAAVDRIRSGKVG